MSAPVRVAQRARAQRAIGDVEPRRGHVPVAGACLLVFFVAGLLLSFRSLAYPWFYDDLHLVRTFSANEIAHAFIGTWDIDGVETVGYRPLTLLFNHTRALVFGENVLAHRLFVLALFAAYLSLLTLVAARLGMPTWQAVLGGVLTLAAKDSSWGLVWISDGVHAFAGLLVMGAGYLLVSGTSETSRWKLPASVILAGLALLTREEPLGVYPVLPALGLGVLLVSHGSPRKLLSCPESRRHLLGVLGVSLALVAVATAYLLLRLRVLAGATSLAPALAPHATGWVRAFVWVLFPMGFPGRDVFADPVSLLWVAALFVLVGTAGRWMLCAARYRATFWFGCAVVACLPSIFATRPNTLLFPISFASLGIAQILGELICLPGLTAKAGGSLIALLLLFAAAARNMTAQENLDPLSLTRIQVQESMLFGEYAAARAGIPTAREAAARTELAVYGIRSHADFLRIFPQLVSDAQHAGRDAPDSGQGPFIPRSSLLRP